MINIYNPFYSQMCLLQHSHLEDSFRTHSYTCTRGCMLEHAQRTATFRCGHRGEWAHANNGAAGSIRRAPAVRSETAEGTEGKRLPFFNRKSVCMCFCVSVWGLSLYMQHSSLLRMPRPHVPADLTVSDRTSPFSTNPPPISTSSSDCPWLDWIWSE